VVDSDNVCERVTRVLTEALNVDDGEVQPSATLRDELGAESIDFLDIVFRLEREFGIKIPSGELFPESIFQGDPEFVQDGQVTDKGVKMLRERMPYANLSGFEFDRRLATVSDMFTVELVIRYVTWKLGRPSGPAAAPVAPALASAPA
jgi:acyl carrier protein